MKPRIGVLALQGDFLEHEQALQKLGYPTQQVRTLADTTDLAGIILPGGESTAIGKLLHSTGLNRWLQQQAKRNFPIYGTCAGCILIAKQVDSPYSVKLINITVQRNAYGRQLDSFETVLTGPTLKNVAACFIRAPKITAVGKAVQILLKYKTEAVLVQQGNMLAGTFHPELTDSLTVHQYFAKLVEAYSAH